MLDLNALDPQVTEMTSAYRSSEATVCVWCGETHHMHSLCKPEDDEEVEDPDEWEVSEEPSEDDEDE